MRNLLSLFAAFHLKACMGITLVLGACSPDSSFRTRLQDRGPRSLKQIEKSGVLRVAIKNGATTFYVNKDGDQVGFELDLVKSFAETQEWDVELIEENSIEDVLEAVTLGQADLAASFLSVTQAREKRFLFSSPYTKVQQTVVCREPVKPKDLQALKKIKLVVEAGTSYEERMESYAAGSDIQNWRVDNSKTSVELIEELAENPDDKGMDCTLIDSLVSKLYLTRYPSLNASMRLGESENIAWLFPRESTELKQKASIWIESAEKMGLIKKHYNRYFAATHDFDPFDLKTFVERIEERLPDFKMHFQNAATEYDLDWRLLAAVGYQESHWEPNAKSPTGVRGLMMLTQKTAEAMGVKNRTDPVESIFGGAKYLRQLITEVSPFIEEKDKIWVALASYNVGAAHIKDARALAVWEKHNPNDWTGIRNVLPLLAKKKYYWRLRHGYARGHEPVVYVRRIRSYYDLLKRQSP